MHKYTKRCEKCDIYENLQNWCKFQGEESWNERYATKLVAQRKAICLTWNGVR